MFDPTGEYGPRSLRQLAYGLRDAFRLKGIEPLLDPVAAHRSLEIVRIAESAEAARHDYQERLNRAHAERDEAIRGARKAERRLRIAQRDHPRE